MPNHVGATIHSSQTEQIIVAFVGFSHTYIYKLTKCTVQETKSPVENLVRQRCAKVFNSGVKWLRRGSAAVCLLGVWIVSCGCCVLSRRGPFIGLITRSKSPTDCAMSECDREASIIRGPWPTGGCCATEIKPVGMDKA
jgi:hypothetical protein